MHLISLTRSPNHCIYEAIPLCQLAPSFSAIFGVVSINYLHVEHPKTHIRLYEHLGLCTANRLTYLLSANLL